MFIFLVISIVCSFHWNDIYIIKYPYQYSPYFQQTKMMVITHLTYGDIHWHYEEEDIHDIVVLEEAEFVHDIP